MKQHFRQTLFLICAVLIMVCAVSAWAFAEEATATDLAPEAAAELPEEADGAAESVEIIITKSLRIGQGWEGRSKKTKPAVLKLDVEKEQTVYMILEGKNVCAAVRKADEAEENSRKYATDPETKLKAVSWRAEKGSYLITVYPEENCLMVQAKVTFLTEEAFEAWEAARAEAAAATEAAAEDTEEEAAGETAETAEKKTEETTEDAAAETAETPEAVTEEEASESGSTEEPAFVLPEDRSIYIDLNWDTENPQIGDVAHFESVISGYESVTYTLQWQTSWDLATWTDFAGATAPQLDVVLTEELDGMYFRLVIYIESEQEEV